MRSKLKSYLKKLPIVLLLFLCFGCPNKVIFAKDSFSANNQSLEVGISYLDLRKSFLDFPVVWKSTMPIFSVSYQVITGRFYHRLSLDYGKSTYIDVNDSRRWGKNNFSFLGFSYDFLWYKQRHKENPRFFWGLGASLENIEIDQKLEISPAKYNRYEDHYFGIGPTVSLFWRLGRARFGLGLGSIFSIPYASYGIMRSDAAFTDRYYLWWVRMTTNVYYEHKIMRTCDLLIQFGRDALAYGRTHRKTWIPKRFYAYGSFLLKSLQISLRYNF